MRYGILSDIHGNLEALDAALDALGDLDIDQYICLGDIVGYGADPNGCIARVQGLTHHVIVGNHDHAAIGLTDITYFNAFARRAVLWTSSQLSQANANYLRNLPFVLNAEAPKVVSEDDVLFVHATPDCPERWRYILTESEARRQLAHLQQHLCFIGHSHQPVMFWRAPDQTLQVADEEMSVDPHNKAIINVGSVGQPRDRDPRAAFATWDTHAGLIRIHRIAYDIQQAQRKIRDAGLPEILAQRLEYGE